MLLLTCMSLTHRHKPKVSVRGQTPHQENKNRIHNRSWPKHQWWWQRARCAFPATLQRVSSPGRIHLVPAVTLTTWAAWGWQERSPADLLVPFPRHCFWERLNSCPPRGLPVSRTWRQSQCAIVAGSSGRWSYSPGRSVSWESVPGFIEFSAILLQPWWLTIWQMDFLLQEGVQVLKKNSIKWSLMGFF